MKTISSIFLMFMFVLATDVNAQSNSSEEEAEISNDENERSVEVDYIQPENLNLNSEDRDFLERQADIKRTLLQFEGTFVLGHRGGNGGDTIASEFTTIANNAAIIWEDICKMSSNYLCAHREDFKTMLDKENNNFVKVLSTKKVFADDDQERDAVNFIDINGTSHIIVGADRWEELSKDYYRKYDKRVIIVLHEYLSLLGVESSDFYDFSRELVTLMKTYNYDIKKISSNEKLPTRCSTKIIQDDSIDDSLYRDLKTFMSERDYSLKTNTNESRYIMKTNLNCDRGGLFSSTSCAVYTEIVDNYMNGNTIVYDKLETYKEWLRKNKVIDIAFNNALNEIKYCE